MATVKERNSGETFMLGGSLISTSHGRAALEVRSMKAEGRPALVASIGSEPALYDYKAPTPEGEAPEGAVSPPIQHKHSSSLLMNLADTRGLTCPVCG